MSEAIAEPPYRSFTELPPREAAGRPDLLVVDVRQPEELQGELGHIPGAVHLPLEILFRTGPPTDWPRDVPLLLVCRGGARSADAAMQLAARGFTELHNLTGGMLAWNRAGLAVARGNGPPRPGR